MRSLGPARWQQKTVCRVLPTSVVLEEEDDDGRFSSPSLNQAVFNFVDPSPLGDLQIGGESCHRACLKTTKKHSLSCFFSCVKGQNYRAICSTICFGCYCFCCCTATGQKESFACMTGVMWCMQTENFFPLPEHMDKTQTLKTINTLCHLSLPCPRFAQLLSLGYMMHALQLPEHLLWATMRDREMS